MEAVNNLALLVESTSSLVDQTMMNLEVIVGLVDIFRQIINERNLESGQVLEVRIVLVKISSLVITFPVHLYASNPSWNMQFISFS